ncbi:hypothetical protein CI102_11267 [Trichoderma harzianum]|nr:hypothetical protein CI102_11267 [Trichoderma harzianum]
MHPKLSETRMMLNTSTCIDIPPRQLCTGPLIEYLFLVSHIECSRPFAECAYFTCSDLIFYVHTQHVGCLNLAAINFPSPPFHTTLHPPASFLSFFSRSHMWNCFIPRLPPVLPRSPPLHVHPSIFSFSFSKPSFVPLLLIRLLPVSPARRTCASN